MGTFTPLIQFKKFAIDQGILLIKMSFLKNNPSHPKCDLTVGTTLSEARDGTAGWSRVAPLGSVVRRPPGALPTESTFLHEA